MKIILASSNEGKAKEFQALLPAYKLELFKDFEKLKIEENEKSFMGNALLKAKSLEKKLGLNTFILADDSGLCVEALKGAPGLYSARYSKEGSQKANIKKLIKELEKLGLTQSKAYFHCALALLFKGERYSTNGLLYGKVITKPSGDEGFGYDPIFIPKGFDKSLASLGENIKDKISHRASAVNRMKIFLDFLS